MATVTQTIPNYVLGISTQPDEQKLPGQVVDLKNAVPDVVRQCIKRPGSHLVTQITPDTGANAKWFDIYTDTDEKYIGQVANDGDVTVWRCSDGVEIPVDYNDVPGTGVATYLDNTALTDEKSSDIQVTTINETTFFVNRRKTVTMETDVQKKSPKLVNEAFIDLKQIAYGKQYALDICEPGDTTEYTSTRATGIYVNPTINTGSVTGYTSNGECSLAVREVAVPGVLNANGATATQQQTGTNTQVTADSEYGQFDTTPPNPGASGRRNLMFLVDLRCQPIPDDNDDADDYIDSYQPNVILQFGGEGWDDNDTIDYRLGNDARLTVHVRSHSTVTSFSGIAGVRPAPTPASSEQGFASAGSILGGIRDCLDGLRLNQTGQFGTQGTAAHGITTTIAGNGIHLYRNDPFVVTTPEKTLMSIITTEANNVADLPSVCRHGYVVKIINSGDDQDDYYLRFRVNKVTTADGSNDLQRQVNWTRGEQSATIPTSSVNTSNERITLTGHNWATGDDVYYHNGGGTDIGGLSSNDTQYFIIAHDANTISLATSSSNATAGTAINLTGTGNNAQYLIRYPDEVTITDPGHGFENNDRVMITYLDNTASVTNGIYTIARVSTDTFNVTDPAFGLITGTNWVQYSKFVFGEGVWEEVAEPDSEIEFNKDTMPLKLTRVLPSTGYTIATSDVDTGNNRLTMTAHGRSTGDAVIYERNGGTAIAGLNNLQVYYIIKVDDNTISLADSASNATAGTVVGITGTGNNAQRITYGYFSINGGDNTHYSNGAFRFGYPDWGKRDAGDDVSNPKPSFVDQTINKLIFFRNRIGLLSGENVILSRANDFYNFWAKTALTISNADPVDLQSSSTYPTQLYDAVEVNAGLAIFSASEQFLLSSGAEALLTPETAQISFLSSYAFNSDTEPLTLGTHIGFLNSTGKNARYYEMGNINPREDPDVVEQSKVITKLFPDNITLPTESNENNLILFAVDGTLSGNTNSKEVWGYKWYQQGNERAQSAWFRWELPNPVVYHTILDDTYYAVLSPNSDPHSNLYTLERFDLKLADDTLLIGTDPDTNRVHLDTKTTIASADLTYDSSANITTFTLGNGYNSPNTLSVYCTTDSPNIGKSEDVHQEHIDKTFGPTDINTTDDTITILNHGLHEGHRVTFQEGSSSVGGLTDNTVYFVVVIDDDTIKLATSRANAIADTPTVVNITGTGAGTHTFETPTVTLSGNWKTSNIEVASSSSTVDVDADTITSANHKLITGSALTYQEGTSAITGLTDNTTYYAIKVDVNRFKLATSSSNATAGTAINLTGTGSGTQTFEVHTDLIVGYEYEFEVELPKVYLNKLEGEKVRSETRGSLVLHRMNFNFGDVGVIDVTLKRKGRDDYTSTLESKEWNSTATTDEQAIADGYIHTVPIYERNTNLNVHIKSNHPSPATLNSMNWEGDYSPKYYRRV